MEQTQEVQQHLIKNHPLSQTVITRKQAIKLIGEENDPGPYGKPMTDEEFNKYVNETTGMTFEQYANFRWPDEPYEQYKLILEDLNIQE